ncbi:MAG: DUF2807 domain-containing protein [Thalassovita sp.]
MSRILPIAILAATTATGVAAETKDFNLNGFDKVQISAGVEVTVVTGKEFRVIAEAKRGSLRRLHLDVDGDTLEIGRAKGFGLLSGSRRDKFEVTVMMPELTKVDARSGSSVDVSGTATILEQATASSGARLDIEAVTTSALDLEASSGATVRVAGACGTLHAESRSGSSLSGSNLICKTGELDVSSGASIKVHIQDSVDSRASSGGSIRIAGGATQGMTETKSGGSVRFN